LGKMKTGQPGRGERTCHSTQKSNRSNGKKMAVSAKTASGPVHRERGGVFIGEGGGGTRLGFDAARSCKMTAKTVRAFYKRGKKTASRGGPKKNKGGKFVFEWWRSKKKRWWLKKSRGGRRVSEKGNET